MSRGIGLGAAAWLGLAASPSFAAMALVTMAVGGDHSALLCAQGSRFDSLAGMTPMYLMMALFHLGPWLGLAGRRQSK